MDYSRINNSFYTHIHFAFGGLTSDFNVNITDISKDFVDFSKLREVQRILSFGGWAESTDAATYNNFRSGVQPANQQTLATNLANFINQNDLDGIDIDWEYAAEPDIPGIPADDPKDGDNYFTFLKTLRGLLPNKSLSIAAPASYWYLKGIPIANISQVVDYIVYMTYDLHGQWDYNNQYADEGCPGGDCLRTHVNWTETTDSLAMITKAGVSSNKIAVGVTSYGRAFQMTTAGCTGPMCTYTGPSSGATPGRCTGTAGYIGNAEINEIIQTNPSATVTALGDDLSSILVYNDTQWVSYMDDNQKTQRGNLYQALNFGGATDWAVDLQVFDPDEHQVIPQPGYLNWTQLNCKNDAVNFTNTSPYSQRWDTLDADAAWNDSLAWWNEYKNGNENFTQELSDFFKEPISMHCEVLVENNGCSNYVQCVDGQYTGPASYFILNSFVTINNVS